MCEPHVGMFVMYHVLFSIRINLVAMWSQGSRSSLSVASSRTSVFFQALSLPLNRNGVQRKVLHCQVSLIHCLCFPGVQHDTVHCYAISGSASFICVLRIPCGIK